jgi:hypothetical protein
MLGVSAVAAAPLLSFKAAAKDAKFTAALSKDLTLIAERNVDADGKGIGWDLSVVDARVKDSPNFLMECLCGHGPFPSELFAWTVRDDKMAARVLHVYGYPFDLKVTFAGVKIGGKEYAAGYTDGAIEVTAVPLAKPNPKQTKTPR